MTSPLYIYMKIGKSLPFRKFQTFLQQLQLFECYAECYIFNDVFFFFGYAMMSGGFKKRTEKKPK